MARSGTTAHGDTIAPGITVRDGRARHLGWGAGLCGSELGRRVRLPEG